MSLVSIIGPRPNLLGHHAGNYLRLEVAQPILTNTDLEKIRDIDNIAGGAFRTQTIDITWPASEGADGMEKAIFRICQEATEAVLADYTILILSDREVGENRIPIPSLLATAAVHNHLIRQGLRMSTGIVVETGEAREVHHFCVLAGYGAEAINPYLAFETLEQIRVQSRMKKSAADVKKNYLKAVGKGIMKVMSKMGISTYQSYCGAQIFDAVGLTPAFVEKCFTGTATTIEGVGFDEIAEEAVARHRAAYGNNPIYREMLDVGGDYAFRLRGEAHAWTPESISRLQHAVRGNLPAEFHAFTRTINDQSERLLTIRGLMDFNFVPTPVPLEEVEPAKEIVKRFATGAMSFGSISREAHTTLAIAMNRIGGKSNTGEGGEESDRYKPLAERRFDRSAIKQVASGRFGVTTEYLVNADDMQIKMAQGAKPGEGGQLPGHKVDKNIARVRHSTPGVGLISPPPHHDIYSIEDLAQLIHDLKNANPQGAHIGETGVRGRRRHRRRRRVEGARRPRHDRRLRGRHRRQPVDLADPCRLAVGNRPRRNPADPGAERAAQPHRGAGRRRSAHRPRRRDRRSAGGRRVRLRHRAVDRGGLRHDAEVPPEHLPGRRGDAGSGPAQALHRHARARHQFLLLHRGGSARNHGATRISDLQ